MKLFLVILAVVIGVPVINWLVGLAVDLCVRKWKH